MADLPLEPLTGQGQQSRTAFAEADPRMENAVRGWGREKQPWQGQAAAGTLERSQSHSAACVGGPTVRTGGVKHPCARGGQGSGHLLPTAVPKAPPPSPP